MLTAFLTTNGEWIRPLDVVTVISQGYATITSYLPGHLSLQVHARTVRVDGEATPFVYLHEHPRHICNGLSALKLETVVVVNVRRPS